MDLDAARDLCANIKAELQKVIVGQEVAVELLLVSLLADGHVLLEGVPGTAKTLLARAFAASLSLEFGRIQFTPDLMPGDVIGTNIFNFQANDFRLIKGPVFAQILLADEINRAPPKTQAALLQAMNERQVTIDGTDYPLGQGFMVIATQNPIEQQGTYPLPEAQLDRFLFKHILPYPSAEEERDIVARHGQQTTLPSLDAIARVAGLEHLVAARTLVQAVTMSQDVTGYIVEIVRATRQHPNLQFGASPRAAIMIASAARARATLAGRDFVLPDDVKSVVAPALRHRVVLAPGAELEAVSVEQVIDEIVTQVAAPR
jgi:MoxR-like ATPase